MFLKNSKKGFKKSPIELFWTAKNILSAIYFNWRFMIWSIKWKVKERICYNIMGLNPIVYQSRSSFWVGESGRATIDAMHLIFLLPAAILSQIM